MSAEPMTRQAADVDRARRQVARGLGVSQFAMGLGGEIVDVVERMHGTISRAPLPWQREVGDRAFGIAGLVYRIIRRSFGHLETGFAEASRALHPEPHGEDDGWLAFAAALNGVCGDALAEKRSPLAFSMQLLGPTSGRAHRVIFLHGLCMSERGWRHGAHPDFALWLRNEGDADLQYLRYNSGLHISDNGASLADLLEREAGEFRQLSLIGHSMGGLLIRAALHCATQRGHSWPRKLVQAAMLGSPHHGSPLERLGNRANRLLTISPYLKPLARMGELRSAGIRDLRFGNLTAEDWKLAPDPDHHDDWREPLPLPQGPRYLLLAASLSEQATDEPWKARHDYLVPVASALGLSRDRAWQLRADDLTRELLPAMNHMELLHNPRVYVLLRSWLRCP